MSPRNRIVRVLAAFAGLSLVPAYLYIEAGLVSDKVGPQLVEQESRLAMTLAELPQRHVVCRTNSDSPSSITGSQALHLLGLTLDSTRYVNRPFQGQTLFWSFKKGLPFTGGLYAIYSSSGHIQDLLARTTGRSDLCRRIRDADDDDEAGSHEAALLAEEKRSQAWLDERLQELEALSGDLAKARTTYEADRPKLAAVAWTLGLLQVIGWSLLYFVVLPQSLRTLREQRAAKKGRAD